MNKTNQGCITLFELIFESDMINFKYYPKHKVQI